MLRRTPLVTPTSRLFVNLRPAWSSSARFAAAASLPTVTCSVRCCATTTTPIRPPPSTSSALDETQEQEQHAQGREEQQHHHHQHHRIRQVKDEEIKLVTPPKPPSLLRRAWRFFLIFGAVSGFAFATAFDLHNDRVLTRSARCLVSGATILAMYKFTYPESPEQISQMNTRAARALLDLCLLNEGLYIKLGQQVHSLNQILPPEYGKELRVLLDNAPPVDVGHVRRIVQEDLGHSVEELFVEWESQPVASASIAQVHRAKFRTSDGRVHDVAVKVQKPNIRTQMWWDLQCYFIFCFCLHRGFGLPVWWSAQHIAEKLTMEIDFRKEAEHIECARELLLADAFTAAKKQRGITEMAEVTGEDAGDVYVPRVFRDALSPRVLVTEWIESVKLHEKEKVQERFDVAAVMTTVVRSFADLVFTHGFVHADPHPANVLLRPHPKLDRSSNSSSDNNNNNNNNNNNKCKHHQVVYIDWGLAMKESESFKRDYARLFTAVFMRDETVITDIIRSWGISDPQLFASMMMQKPISFDKSQQPLHKSVVTKADVLQMQQRMKEKAASLLEDESKTPKELILLGRGMNLIRSVNKSFGAPVNRVNILAEGAARGLGGSGAFGAGGGRLAEWRFHASLAWLSFLFYALQWYARVVNWFSVVFIGKEAAPTINLETVLEDAEKKIVEQHVTGGGSANSGAEGSHHSAMRLHEND